MADRTRPIVRLDIVDRMVTKGYRKGVYERVTKGIGEEYLLADSGLLLDEAITKGESTE